MKPIQISTHSYKGQDFDVLVNKNKVSYIFEYNGSRYGNAVTVKGRTRQATVDAVFNLILNLISTYDAVLEKEAGNSASSTDTLPE